MVYAYKFRLAQSYVSNFVDSAKLCTPTDQHYRVTVAGGGLLFTNLAFTYCIFAEQEGAGVGGQERISIQVRGV